MIVYIPTRIIPGRDGDIVHIPNVYFSRDEVQSLYSGEKGWEIYSRVIKDLPVNLNLSNLVDNHREEIELRERENEKESQEIEKNNKEIAILKDQLLFLKSNNKGV